MIRSALAPWPRGQPPRLELIPLGTGAFQLRTLAGQLRTPCAEFGQHPMTLLIAIFFTEGREER